MKCELVTRREDLGALAQRWDELARSDPRDGFFRTSGWYLAWLRHVRPDAEPFVVVVRDAGGNIIGLAPLCRVKYRDLGFRLAGISWGGREVVSGDFLGFLADGGATPQVIPAILDFLYRMRSQWSLMIIGELIDGSQSCHAVETLAQEHRLPIRRQEERICPYIALPPSFDEYLNTLSSATRYNIRRRIREFEKKGGCARVYSGPEEISHHLDTLIRLHLERWRRDNLPGTFGRPGFAAFLREVCTQPPAGSTCRLHLLTWQAAPVAALLTFYFGDSALYYQAGWDSQFSSQSPGLVAMAHSIRDAIEHGVRYYEFLRGDEAYKSRWTKTYRKTATILVGQSLMSKQYLRAARLKDIVKYRIAGVRRNPASSSSGQIPPGDGEALEIRGTSAVRPD